MKKKNGRKSDTTGMNDDHNEIVQFLVAGRISKRVWDGQSCSDEECEKMFNVMPKVMAFLTGRGDTGIVAEQLIVQLLTGTR